jgi:hypothetical protein
LEINLKIEVSEDVLYSGSLAIKNMQITGEIEQTTNAYENALNIGKKFKDAGLNPFYVFDDITQSIFVTSVEHIDKKLN